jgi:hypothetical protein
VSGRALLVAVVAGAVACAAPRPTCPLDHIAVIGSQGDIDRLAGCTKLTGLTIRSGASLDVTALASVEEISGDVELGPTVGVDEISLRGVRIIAGTLHAASNGSMQGLFLPRLEQVGRIEVDGNGSLTTISLPRLLKVAGSVVVTDNADLELLDVPNLERVGNELLVAGNRQLVLLQAARLREAGAIRLERNAKLAPTRQDELKAQLGTPLLPREH